MPFSLSTHLQSTKAPWASLLILKPGQRAESLVEIPNGYLLKAMSGAKCRTASGLFAEFAQALKFPDYFGHNWDALEECLADLEWLPAKGYVLVLTDAEKILPDEDEYATFLEVINDAGESWAAGMEGRRSKPFHVVFAVAEKDKSKRSHWGMEPIGPQPHHETGTGRGVLNGPKRRKRAKG